ncbi:SDR family NAD(P)-dependent oxidoreductase [Curtobacterium sp. S6]|uniref:SDR family NAD(P)-dependent oxidoreductase n=1 Tax=Curtobacterium sp. S6 TaxID=1479623 RepID=UPI0004AAD5BA|nr:glucose 1-dehydrogenase [Curtobacterium sp. S6]
MQLTEKVALVTGGGQGIGRGIVERFLEEGAQVVIAQRSPLDADLQARPDVAHVVVDLSDSEALADVAEQAAQAFGALDILVNNAGFMAEHHISELPLKDWQRMDAVNVTAPLFLSQAVVAHLRERGGGSIINIGSVEGILTNPAHAAYAASKAAVHGMTRAMAIDLGPLGIRCNAIAPGWITSELSETYLDSKKDPAAARTALFNLHPIGRLGQPADVGDLAVFLGGDRSAFLSGEVIVLDGGRTIRLPTPE